MSGHSGILILFVYITVFILPSFMFGLGIWLTGYGDPVKTSRRRLLLLLFSADLSALIIGLLIWMNPYGREINSSFQAIGMLPVLVASLALVLDRWREVIRLWSTDKTLLLIFSAIFLIAGVSLWLAEHLTFYYIAGFTALLVVIRQISIRSNLIVITLLSIVCALCLIMGGGGTFFTLTLESPDWIRRILPYLVGFSTWISIFLVAAILSSALQDKKAPGWRKFFFQMLLVIFLLGSSCYQIFWDGIWSSAHARAFEDHLPFVHILFGLAAGVFLAFSLQGKKRLAGPGFVILLSVLSIAALSMGWRVSAFQLTEHRARDVNKAILNYYRDTGGYPVSLDQLTPDYLLYLPPPVVVRQGGWCYQASPDDYRFGYISGVFSYSKADFFIEVFSQGGKPPESDWVCDELLEKFKMGELVH